MIKIDAATGARADDTLRLPRSRTARAGAAASRAPWIFKRCGYYYLFSSWGACCDGAYDYNIRVGRSTSVNGPTSTRPASGCSGGGGGTLLVQGNSTVHAPGHNAVIVYNNKTYNMYHALNASNGNASLHIAEIAWDAQRLARLRRAVDRAVPARARSRRGSVAADREHVRVPNRRRRRDQDHAAVLQRGERSRLQRDHVHVTGRDAGVERLGAGRVQRARGDRDEYACDRSRTCVSGSGSVHAAAPVPPPPPVPVVPPWPADRWCRPCRSRAGRAVHPCRRCRRCFRRCRRSHRRSCCCRCCTHPADRGRRRSA